MTPKQIVEELDRYIVGQTRAKRALALAFRDRLRRKRLPEDMAEEVRPRNIILIGSTGVGKTELARRLAKVSRSPFVKVEASKFTEVGYVGRDVETIIRDLTEVSVEMLRQERVKEVEQTAEENAENRLLDILASRTQSRRKKKEANSKKKDGSYSGKRKRSRDRLRKDLREGKLKDKTVELEIQERFYPALEMGTSYPDDEVDLQFRDLLASMIGTRTFKKKVSVSEAIDYLVAEEESMLIDMDQITREALHRVEQNGIVFIDELDKIAGRESGHGPDVSREGVQRDILPIVEGTSVSTRYGTVETDRILFVAAGAFHVSKPSDLIPELQGRFPIRVEMNSLNEQDFVQILHSPENALIKQYCALMETEGIRLSFTSQSIREIARFAQLVNESSEDIGARRLHTVMEALLEDISFEASESKRKSVRVNAAYVRKQLSGLVQDGDLSRHIL